MRNLPAAIHRSWRSNLNVVPSLWGLLAGWVATVAQAALPVSELPGKGTDLGIGANGAVWMIGWDTGDQNRDIFRWTGTEWSIVEGRGKRISVDPQGNPWKLNKDGEFQRWNGTQFVSLPGKGTDLSVGANGAVWMIGWYTDFFDTDFNPKNRSIYQWNGSDWTEVPGGGVRIAVAPDGTPWIIDHDGKVMKRVGSDWVEQDARAQDIAIGADGSIYITGHAGWVDDGRIDRWNGTTWVDQEIEGQAIAVGPDGLPWFAQSDGDLYRAVSPATPSTLSVPQVSAGVVTVQFTTQAGRKHTFRVQRTLGGPWETLQVMTGTGAPATAQDAPPNGTEFSFYSVLTE